MSNGYKKYLDAVTNRRGEEMTFYDKKTELYYNVKIYPKPKKWFLMR